MNRAPAFQFYPDKWLSHTRRLSDSAYRVYHELLCWMWQSSPDQCSIDANPDAVACVIGMPLPVVRSAMEEIQNPFCPLLKTEGDRWICHGILKEVEKQTAHRERQTANATARWNRATASENDATALPRHEKKAKRQCSHSSSPSTSSNNTPNPPGGNGGRVDIFEEKRFVGFWHRYPRKERKYNAVEVWNKLAPDDATIKEIARGLKRWNASEQWDKDDGAYVPMPDKWLSERRWEDEPTPAKPMYVPGSGNSPFRTGSD